MSSSVSRSLLSFVLIALTCHASANGQDVPQVRRASVGVPGEAFVNDQPLANVRLEKAFYNLRQQRLREHHLEVPLAPLPQERADRNVVPAAEGQRETVVEEVPGQHVQLLRNRPLGDQEVADETSTVCEPSVASRGQEVLITGNWFSGFSTDGGETFTYVNPYTTFPQPSNQPFCCDQVAFYDRRHDLMVWFLQYAKGPTGNTIRIAVAAGDDIRLQRWRYYDFTPAGVGGWKDEWFDFPDVASSDMHLFITTNSFSLKSQYRRAACLRLPLEALRTYQSVDFDFFETPVGSLRPTQGATDTMYIGGHYSQGTVRIFRWPTAGQLDVHDVDVSVWARGGSAVGPDGRDWLGASDGRITAAWANADHFGFGWNGNKDKTYPMPHVRSVILDRKTLKPVAEPHIWSSKFAFAYPAFGPNAQGRVGVSLCFGGSATSPSHAVGVLQAPEDQAGSDKRWTWRLVQTAQGGNGPARNRWGDYLAVRAQGGREDAYVATGFVMRGGSDNGDVEVRYVEFAATREGAPHPSASDESSLIRADLQRLRNEIKLLREEINSGKQGDR